MFSELNGMSLDASTTSFAVALVDKVIQVSRVSTYRYKMI
jgi:hypothetical protein